MKTMQFSDRPWRYERCIVYELDLEVVREDLTQFKPNKPKIIHRIVANNQTLTIFENFDYTKMDISFILPDLKFEDYTDNNNCVRMSNMRTGVGRVVCTPDQYDGDHLAFIQQFRERVTFMRDRCHNKLPVITFTKNVLDKD